MDSYLRGLLENLLDSWNGENRVAKENMITLSEFYFNDCFPDDDEMEVLEHDDDPKTENSSNQL